MKSNTLMYIGAVILFFLSACGLGLGGFIYLASLDPVQGQPSWGTFGGTLMCIGTLTIIGGVVLIVLAVRKTKQETAQNVTVKIDLPGDTKVEEMKCKSCGGVLSSNDIKLMAGAPVVTCPYCSTTYQLTEEPKW